MGEHDNTLAQAEAEDLAALVHTARRLAARCYLPQIKKSNGRRLARARHHEAKDLRAIPLGAALKVCRHFSAAIR